MLQTKDVHKLKVYVEDKKERMKKYGRVRNVIFHPSKPVAVGVTVKRPDLAMMVKRKDRFVAMDKISVLESGDILVQLSDNEAWDNGACKRLGIDYDECIIWDGMAVRNLDKVELGVISNICVDESNMRILSIDVSSGDVNRAILGSADIAADKLKGYDPNMEAIVADVQPEDIEVAGGVAAKAGEAWAKGTHKMSQTQAAVSDRAAENIEQTAYAAGEAIGSIRDKVSAKVKDTGAGEKTAEISAKAGEAINEGAYKLGRAINNLRGDDDAIEAEAVEVKTAPADAEAESGTPKIVSDVKKRAQAAKKKADEDEDFEAAARAVGAHLKKTKGMFSAFKEEFDKASK